MSVSNGNKAPAKFAFGERKVLIRSDSGTRTFFHFKLFIVLIILFLAIQMEDKNANMIKKESLQKGYISDEESKRQLLKQQMIFDQQQRDIQVATVEIHDHPS